MTQHLLPRERRTSPLGAARDGGDVEVPSEEAASSSRARMSEAAGDGVRRIGRGREPGLREGHDDAHAVHAVRAAWLVRFAQNLAPQDWYISAYFGVILLALAFGSGPDRPACLRLVGTDVALFATGLAITRGGILRHGTFLNAIVYRLTVFLGVFLSYFQLRHILPAVSERAVDADLFAFDMRVFHVEPSLAWDRFVTPDTTEWFAFFYFGYFFLLAMHVLSMMLAAKDVFRLSHFAMGIFIVFCTGHLIYMVVPGYGPYRYLEGAFRHPLSGGIFWGWVKATVSAGGAQKDIFPSLHTATPTFFALYSFRHRRVAPFKYTWPLVAFAAAQIICATMFLRWHYLVDIFAGITLAATAVILGEKLVRWDMRRRARANEARPGSVEPIFELLDYRSLVVRPGMAHAGDAARISRPSRDSHDIIA